MFGISLVEFLTILTIAIIAVNPKDWPEIVRFIVKNIAKAKQFLLQSRGQIDNFKKEAGLEEIYNEVSMEMAKEKSQMQDEITTIIDVYGNEHRVANITDLHPEKSAEELAKEVEKANENNKNSQQTSPTNS